MLYSEFAVGRLKLVTPAQALQERYSANRPLSSFRDLSLPLGTSLAHASLFESCSACCRAEVRLCL